MKQNYIDAQGNYHNVENLTLTQIYEQGFRSGLKYKLFLDQESREFDEEARREAHDLD